MDLSNDKAKNRDLLLKSMNNASGKLLERSDDAKSLRRLQDVLVELQGDDKSDRDVIFVSFIISMLIEDFFYNFAADIPYSKEMYELRNQIIRNFGLFLKEICECFESDNQKMFQSFKDHIAFYIEMIRRGQQIRIT